MKPDTQATCENEDKLDQVASKARSELEKLYHEGEDMALFVSSDNEQHNLRLPSTAVKLLMEILEQLALEKSVSVVAHDKMLTTQQVADILRVSRPFVTKLIDNGELECTMVGTHRRVRFVDVIKYKEDIDKRREANLDALVAQAQELGLGY